MYCNPNSKYLRNWFPLQPPPQIWCSCGLPDWRYTKENECKWKCKATSWPTSWSANICFQCFWNSEVFLGQVECVISETVHLLASKAAICCVFCQLATRGVKILLGK